MVLPAKSGDKSHSMGRRHLRHRITRCVRSADLDGSGVRPTHCELPLAGAELGPPALQSAFVEQTARESRDLFETRGRIVAPGGGFASVVRRLEQLVGDAPGRRVLWNFSPQRGGGE